MSVTGRLGRHISPLELVSVTGRREGEVITQKRGIRLNSVCAQPAEIWAASSPYNPTEARRPSSASGDAGLLDVTPAATRSSASAWAALHAPHTRYSFTRQSLSYQSPHGPHTRYSFTRQSLSYQSPYAPHSTPQPVTVFPANHFLTHDKVIVTVPCFPTSDRTPPTATSDHRAPRITLLSVTARLRQSLLSSPSTGSQ